MQLSPSFTLDELTVTGVGLPNKPGKTEIAYLRALAVNVLQPLRDDLRKPIFVSSGLLVRLGRSDRAFSSSRKPVSLMFVPIGESPQSFGGRWRCRQRRHLLHRRRRARAMLASHARTSPT